MLTAAFILICIYALLSATSYLININSWNKGICKKSGKPWICFDTDFLGSRMYKDNCGNYCTISYNSVDK